MPAHDHPSEPGRTRSQGARPGLRAFGPWLLVLLVLAVGLTSSVVWGVATVTRQLDLPRTLARAAVPASVAVDVDARSPLVVYWERPADRDGGDPAGPGLTAADLAVTAPDGEPVPVLPYTGELTYDLPDEALIGTAVGVVVPGTPGVYRFGAPGAPAGTRLAVGPDLAPGLVRALLLPAGGVLVTLLAAGVLAARAATRSGPRPTTTPTPTPTRSRTPGR
jgi:hypothetical protein